MFNWNFLCFNLCPFHCVPLKRVCHHHLYNLPSGIWWNSASAVCFQGQTISILSAKVAPDLYIPNQFFLVCKSEFQQTSITRVRVFLSVISLKPPGLFVFCCIVLSEDITVVEVPHVGQGLWMWGFFPLSQKRPHLLLANHIVCNKHTQCHPCWSAL